MCLQIPGNSVECFRLYESLEAAGDGRPEVGFLASGVGCLRQKKELRGWAFLIVFGPKGLWGGGVASNVASVASCWLSLKPTLCGYP